MVILIVDDWGALVEENWALYFLSNLVRQHARQMSKEKEALEETLIKMDFNRRWRQKRIAQLR